MLVAPGGLERTEAEFDELLAGSRPTAHTHLRHGQHRLRARGRAGLTPASDRRTGSASSRCENRERRAAGGGCGARARRPPTGRRARARTTGSTPVGGRAPAARARPRRLRRSRPGRATSRASREHVWSSSSRSRRRSGAVEASSRPVSWTTRPPVAPAGWSVTVRSGLRACVRASAEGPGPPSGGRGAGTAQAQMAPSGGASYLYDDRAACEVAHTTRILRDAEGDRRGSRAGLTAPRRQRARRCGSPAVRRPGSPRARTSARRSRPAAPAGRERRVGGHRPLRTRGGGGREEWPR